MELRYFDVHKDIRVVRDASQNGFGAVLEKIGTESKQRWKKILRKQNEDARPSLRGWILSKSCTGEKISICYRS